MTPNPIERNTRRQAAMIATGVAIALASFAATGPEAFMSFIFLGGGLTGLGILDFARTRRMSR